MECSLSLLASSNEQSNIFLVTMASVHYINTDHVHSYVAHARRADVEPEAIFSEPCHNVRASAVHTRV